MESETNLKTIDGDSRRNLYFLLALLIVAFGLRLYLAITTAYLWDEDRDWIPLAESISFEPGAINLPVRGDFHGALSAYFIKAGAFLIGNTHLGYRFFGLLAGVVTIVVVYRLAFEFAGAIAAKLSAVFIAFNEYHIQVSTMAIQKVYYLLFAGLAIYGFCRFLREQSPRWLYLAAVAVGLAFLCYEISFLLIPAFLLAVVFSGNYPWLKRKEPYLACLLFLLIVTPDLLGNLYGNSNAVVVEKVGYTEHLSRIGGLGISVQPLVFYGRAILTIAYKLAGAMLANDAEEYVGMNPIFGSLLFVLVFLVTILWKHKDSVTKSLLICFWFIFLFFTFIRRGSAGRGHLDMDLWIWVDVTLLPAAVIAGYYISKVSNGWRIAAYAVIVIGSLYSSYRVVFPRLAIPPVSIAYDPEVVGPLKGQMVTVEAMLDRCDICDANSKVELLDISIVEKSANGSLVGLPGIGTPDVVGAELGQDDRTFALRATGGELDRRYDVKWRLTNVLGKTREMTTTLGMNAMSEQRWRQPFWVHRKPAITAEK